MRTGSAIGLDSSQVKWVRVRVGLLAVIFVPLFGVMIARAVKLQVIEGPKMRELAQEQYLDEAQIAPRRGVIDDRNGVPLAASVDVDSISLDPSALPDGAISQLARALGISSRELDKRISHGRHFAWLARGVAPSQLAAVKALGLSALSFHKEPRRFYPQRNLAANVLGFAGVDGEGLEGVELAYNAVLKGKPQSIDIIKDAQRHSVFAQGAVDTDALSGARVELTLDRGIQHIAEQALADVMQKSSPKGAMAVVMDPSNGEVLALASAPGFNPNDPGQASRDGIRDRPVVDSFEPGSTMKPFTLSAALDAKVIKPGDTFFCEHGHYAIGKRVIHDDEPMGDLTISQILQKSSNIGASKIAAKLGPDRLMAYFEAFGFGEKTDLGLPGEVRGVIPTPKNDIRLATESFGQGLTVSAIQLATAYAALANHGELMRPFLVRKVVDPDGTVLESHGPQPLRQVISPRAAQEITAMLETVVQKGGTATRAAMADYTVAGKTGTAQKVDPATGKYSASRRTASFVGFVPADAPKLVIAVVVDEPQGDKYGGDVAAPAFKQIAEAALPLLGVAPQHREPLRLAAATSISSASPDVAEDDEPADTLAAGADQTVVPSVRGLGARDAAKLLSGDELAPQLSGSGQAVGQVPAAGAVVPRGTKVAVTLQTGP